MLHNIQNVERAMEEGEAGCLSSSPTVTENSLADGFLDKSEKSHHAEKCADDSKGGMMV